MAELGTILNSSDICKNTSNSKLFPEALLSTSNNNIAVSVWFARLVMILHRKSGYAFQFGVFTRFCYYLEALVHLQDLLQP
jgi:hypothetical protein